ncbi:hypothetical protein ACSBOB_11570 [Mesorhizobium sp. ASY16-5R]|uniref:hypothetical protein n=1 Tax=Mesorhizobium sp. ASY16-5R TaxID=3445772 RepID=UPI003F9F482A
MAPDQRSKIEKIRYLHGLLRELKDIADGERMPFLSHLLEMAYIESGDFLRAANPLKGRT